MLKALTVALSFSQRPQCKIPTNNTRAKAPRYISNLAAFAFFCLLGACNNSPEQADPLVDEVLSQQEIHLAIQTPSAGWSIKPVAVYATETDILCVSQLTPPEGMSASMISEIELSATVTEPSQPKPIHHYVLGKTWKWGSIPEVTFIDSLEEIKEALADAQSVPFTTP